MTHLCFLSARNQFCFAAHCESGSIHFLLAPAFKKICVFFCWDKCPLPLSPLMNSIVPYEEDKDEQIKNFFQRERDSNLIVSWPVWRIFSDFSRKRYDNAVIFYIRNFGCRGRFCWYFVFRKYLKNRANFNYVWTYLVILQVVCFQRIPLNHLTLLQPEQGDSTLAFWLPKLLVYQLSKFDCRPKNFRSTCKRIWKFTFESCLSSNFRFRFFVS